MKTQWVTNAGSLASTKRLLADQVHNNLRSAARIHAKKMKAEAVRLSNGTITAAQLRTYQPGLYSRAVVGVYSPAFDALINSHSGVFKASWRTRVQETKDGWTITLLNDSKEAAYMMGTKRMRMRPILIEVDRILHGELPAQVRKVTRRAGQEYGKGGSAFGAVLYGIGVGATSIVGSLAEAV